MGACLLVGLPLAARPLEQIEVTQREDALELTWSDAEERLKGTLQPGVPRAGEPLRVVLHVGSYQGAAFEGPLTLSLRERGATYGQEQTVKKGDVLWHAEFRPEHDGPHRLDVSFRTTHLKVLHADFDVEPARLPRLLLWALVGLAAGMALVIGVRGLVRQEPPKQPSQ